MNTMPLDHKRIAQNFIIRVYPAPNGGRNALIGSRTFMKIVGDEDLAERIVEDAFACPKTKFERKLRRGTKFQFVSR